MIVESLVILAAEAHSAGEGTFSFNFNLLETNSINLALLVGVLLYFAPKTLGKILGERRSKIAEAIQEAEDRQKEAAVALAEQQQKLAQAQAEAERIRKAAEERAEVARAEIAAQAERDIQRLRETAAQDLSAEQERVMAELRQQIAALALQQAESQLKSQLDEAAQERILDRSIAQLGGRR